MVKEMREKMIEILLQKPNKCTFEQLADFLIANDVVPVVRCKDCKHYENHKMKIYENCVISGKLIPTSPYGFCFYGERKNNE